MLMTTKDLCNDEMFSLEYDGKLYNVDIRSLEYDEELYKNWKKKNLARLLQEWDRKGRSKKKIEDFYKIIKTIEQKSYNLLDD